MAAEIISLASIDEVGVAGFCVSDVADVETAVDEVNGTETLLATVAFEVIGAYPNGDGTTASAVVRDEDWGAVVLDVARLFGREEATVIAEAIPPLNGLALLTSSVGSSSLSSYESSEDSIGAAEGLELGLTRAALAYKADVSLGVVGTSWSP